MVAVLILGQVFDVELRCQEGGEPLSQRAVTYSDCFAILVVAAVATQNRIQMHLREQALDKHLIDSAQLVANAQITVFRYVWRIVR